MEMKLRKMQQRLQAAKKKQGFSLVELMIVIAVIAILFVVLVSRAGFATNKAKEAGVKTDFRAFTIAADQMLRENSGLNGYTTAPAVIKDLNVYLDDAIRFDKDGNCLKADPWNKKYIVDYAALTGDTAGNNGTIVFYTAGQDGVLQKATTDTKDDYAQAVVWLDGYTHTATTGFSSNIEESNFKAEDITFDGSATSNAVETGEIKVKYNGGHTVKNVSDAAADVEVNNGHGA